MDSKTVEFLPITSKNNSNANVTILVRDGYFIMIPNTEHNLTLAEFSRLFQNIITQIYTCKELDNLYLTRYKTRVICQKCPIGGLEIYLEEDHGDDTPLAMHVLHLSSNLMLDCGVNAPIKSISLILRALSNQKWIDPTFGKSVKRQKRYLSKEKGWYPPGHDIFSVTEI
jgi:hypothetical protein